MNTFIAKYASGTCPECESPIKVGEEICRNYDQSFIHVDCPDGELDRLVGKPACPSCWIVGPCDCDEQ